MVVNATGIVDGLREWACRAVVTADPTKLASARRTRAWLLAAAIVVPASCAGLFGRQSRRLDALADHGLPATAVITRVDATGTTHYAYAVDGREHTWNVARAAAPYDVGASIDVLYLPEEPSFTRPVSDRRVVAVEAAGQRRFAHRFVVGAAVVLALLAASAHVSIRRMIAGEDPSDPSVFRRRIRERSAVLVALVATVSLAHVADARARGESLVPTVLGFVLSAALVFGVVRFVAGGGPSLLGERAARLGRIVAPIAAIVAVLRLLWFLTQR